MSAAFIHQLPWSYPSHSHRSWYHPGWVAGRPSGLTMVGTTESAQFDHMAEQASDAAATLSLIRGCPPRMCFALATPPVAEHTMDFGDVFHAALSTARRGDRAAARKMLSDADRRAPMDARICRAFIELLWQRGRARSHFQAVVDMGDQIVRQGFSGALPWAEHANRPFLIGLRGLAWMSWRSGYQADARMVLHSLLWLDPSDSQGCVRWIELIDDGIDSASDLFPTLEFEWWGARPGYDEDWHEQYRSDEC